MSRIIKVEPRTPHIAYVRGGVPEAALFGRTQTGGGDNNATIKQSKNQGIKTR